jgi:hypothetical protein
MASIRPSQLDCGVQSLNCSVMHERQSSNQKANNTDKLIELDFRSMPESGPSARQCKESAMCHQQTSSEVGVNGSNADFSAVRFISTKGVGFHPKPTYSITTALSHPGAAREMHPNSLDLPIGTRPALPDA